MELDRFLYDLLRQGLAAATSQLGSQFDQLAARLVDAQAPGLARLVRELGELAGVGPNWQSRFLSRVARLHLVTQGYRRLADLPSEVQADLRTLVGWNTIRDEVLASEPVGGVWCVVAQQTREEDRLTVQHNWLLRLEDGRAALLLNFSALGAAVDCPLIVGTTIEAELCYYPSAAPLRAIVKQSQSSQTLTQVPGLTTIDALLDDFSQGLALNPWSEAWPVALTGVTMQPLSTERGDPPRWGLVDSQDEVLPIADNFTAGWTLLAVSGGEPFDCVGLWNGESFQPFGALVANGYHACARDGVRAPIGAA